MKRLSKRQSITLLIALFCVAGGVLLSRNSQQVFADAEWLSSRPASQPSRLAFLGRWMWPAKRQVARVRAKLVGPPKIIDLNGLVVEIDPAQSLSLTNASISQTNRSGEVLFVFVDAAFEKTLKATRGVQILTKPRMMVADRMQAQMAITESAAIGSSTNITLQPVGWWVDVWPSTRGGAVELACFITSTERALRETGRGESLRQEAFIRTNLAFGARVTVPTNGALFLLSRSTNQNGKRLGALLSPGIQGR